MKTKIKTAIIVILSIMLAYTLSVNLYASFSHDMPYIYPTIIYYVEYIEPTYNYSKSEIRHKLEDLTNTHFYIYNEKYISKETYGYTNFIFRTITIHKDLPTNKYIEVLCHELLHLKHMTANERFTQYQTFITLYNSEFKQIALNILRNMRYGEYLYEYDCYAQIVEYLEKQPI